MTARVARLTIAVACPLILSGCRIVWVHPDATAEKYQEDTVRCKYGMTPAELQQLVDAASQPLPPQRRNWRQCMQLLGWKTKAAPRAHEVWDTD